MRPLALSITALLVSCAPLNANRMSDRCHDLYDACLNSCRPPPRPVNSAAPYEAGQQRQDLSDLQIDVAGCTNDCNTQSQTCH